MRRKAPAPGDVVIAPDAIKGVGFTLSIGPDGRPQIWYASYQDAFKNAHAWAALSGVSVWRVDGVQNFVLSERAADGP